MPSKQPPLQSSADADPVNDTEGSTDDFAQTPVEPATKRFLVVTLLFCAWLVFLIYLASLTWSGK